MTALSAGRNTLKRDETPIPRQSRVPVAASTKIYAGSFVMLDAGYLKPAAVGVGKIPMGKAVETVDNLTGLDGAKLCTVESGCFRWVNGDSVAQADVGGVAYMVDDQTVAKADGTGTRSMAGRITEVDSSGVWVLTLGFGFENEEAADVRLDAIETTTGTLTTGLAAAVAVNVTQTSNIAAAVAVNVTQTSDIAANTALLALGDNNDVVVNHALTAVDVTTKEHKTKAGKVFTVDTVDYINPTGLAQDATNFAVVKLLNGATVLATWSTETGQQGTLAANTFVSMVLNGTPANLDLAAGTTITLDIDINGVQTLPAGRLIIHGRYHA